MGKLLICTVGLPRAGKSTWSREQMGTTPVVNPDSIRLAIHGQAFILEAEPFVWATAKAMVKSLFIAGHTTVILDATCITRAERDQWKSLEWQTEFKVFDASAMVCEERAGASGRPDLVPVIARMAMRQEPLGDDEKVFPHLEAGDWEYRAAS